MKFSTYMYSYNLFTMILNTLCSLQAKITDMFTLIKDQTFKYFWQNLLALHWDSMKKKNHTIPKDQ